MPDFNWENRIREWSYKRIEALEDYKKEELTLRERKVSTQPTGHDIISKYLINLTLVIKLLYY